MIEKSFEIGSAVFRNRLVLQPMEGFDCGPDGAPGELTLRKYLKAAKSGAGAVWLEASAVCPEGRTNGRQMMITAENADSFSALVSEMRKAAGERQILILQLTHSGRQSRDPIVGYRNPVYEKTRPVSGGNVASDEYLDGLPRLFARTAELAVQAGFDGVDVKACHGYLLSEMLSARDRPGKYGGPFGNRARLYLDCVRAVKRAIPGDALLAARLGISDVVPYPWGFGTDADGNVDFTEPDMLIRRLIGEGVRLLNVTAGNPYYNPYVNRPYRRGGIEPPEPPEAGLARFVEIEKHIKEKFPDLPLVASALSYYREKVFEKAEDLLGGGICDLVGIGRMWLAYPDIYKDYLNGGTDRRRCCTTCSKCTELMRSGRPSGCAVFDGYYRDLYREMKK